MTKRKCKAHKDTNTYPARKEAALIGASQTAVKDHRARLCICYNERHNRDRKTTPTPTNHAANHPKGKLVVFEGIDGSGKSTQARMVEARAKEAGQLCRVLREPADRDMVKQRNDPYDWLADHGRVVAQALQLVDEGYLVIVDRWFPYSGLAYGSASKEFVSNMCAKPVPDLVVLFDVDAETAAQRRGEPDGEFEEADTATFEDRAQVYRDLASGSPYLWHTVDGTQDPQAVHRDLLKLPLFAPLTRAAKSTETRSNVRVEVATNEVSFDNLVTDSPIAPNSPADDGAFSRIFELAGLDPERFELVGDTFRMSVWESGSEVKYAYRGSFRKKTAVSLSDAEFEALVKDVKTAHGTPVPELRLTADPVRVIIASDAQIGKVDSRGGLEEFLIRMERLCRDIRSMPPAKHVLLLDPGDLIEGFQNVESQVHTNDLSHPAMLRVARRVLFDLVLTARSIATELVTVATVPSNHSAWRKGKGMRGKPGDDYGLDVHHAVRDVFEYAAADGVPVEWVWPTTEYDESVAIPVEEAGVRIGLVHGHQTKPGRFAEWWRGQALGSMPLADCHYAVSGHYHTFLLECAGSLDGAERVHIQAPPMDNGSNWYTQIKGDDSRPGVVTFTLDSGGDFHNMELITAD